MQCPSVLTKEYEKKIVQSRTRTQVRRAPPCRSSVGRWVSSENRNIRIVFAPSKVPTHSVVLFFRQFPISGVTRALTLARERGGHALIATWWRL